MIGDVTAAVLDAGRWFDLAASNCEMVAVAFWARMPGGPE